MLSEYLYRVLNVMMHSLLLPGCSVKRCIWHGAHWSSCRVNAIWVQALPAKVRLSRAFLLMFLEQFPATLLMATTARTHVHTSIYSPSSAGGVWQTTSTPGGLNRFPIVAATALPGAARATSPMLRQQPWKFALRDRTQILAMASTIDCFGKAGSVISACNARVVMNSTVKVKL